MTIEIRSLPSLTRLRLPTGDDDDRLAGGASAANREGRASALERSGRSFPGVDLGAIAACTADPQPASTAVSIPLVTPGDVLRRLTPEHLAGRPAIRLGAAEGAHPLTDPTSLVAAMDEAAVRLPSSASVVGALADAADDVATVLSAHVTIDVVVTGPADIAVESWGEAEDRLIVALDGTVDVALFPPGTTPPERSTHRSSRRGGPSPIWAGSVEPGAALWVPSGWGHRRSGPGAWWAEVAIRRQTDGDLAEAVAQRAAGELPFRESIPWDPDGVEPRDDSIFGDPDGLRARFEELDLDALVAEARATWAANLRGRALSADEAHDLAKGRTAAEVSGPGGWVLVEALHPDAEPIPPGASPVVRAGRMLIGDRERLVDLMTAPLPATVASGLVRTGLVRPMR